MLLHPFVVHFTIALLAIAVVCDGLHLVTQKPKFWRYTNFLLVIGTLAAIAAVVTGNQAHDAVEIAREIKPLVREHRNSGEWTMRVFIFLTTMRFIFAKLKWFQKPLKWIYYAVAIIAFVFIFRTGLMGNEIAYIHGVGSEKTEKPLLKKPSFD